MGQIECKDGNGTDTMCVWAGAYEHHEGALTSMGVSMRLSRTRHLWSHYCL